MYTFSDPAAIHQSPGVRNPQVSLAVPDSDVKGQLSGSTCM